MTELYAIVGVLCTSEILATHAWVAPAAIAGATGALCFAAGVLVGRGRRHRRATGLRA